MAIPNQVWSNDKLAGHYETEWESNVATILNRLHKNFTKKSTRVQYRSFIK